jgi:LysM repeat protein
MRAIREILGGLVLAIIAAGTIVGGLWLAVTETGQGITAPTAIAAITDEASPTAFVPTVAPSATPLPTQTNKPLPSLTATLQATKPPTSTATVAASATVAPTATAVASATATTVATLPPTATAITIANSPTPCGPPIGWVQYTVAAGDTLFQLSLRYGVSQQQLQTANCLATTEIKTGQVLFVPFAASATPQAATATATVVPSDTPVPSPLIIGDVSVAGVQNDPSRPNGAIATLYVTVSGGVVPYTFYNGTEPQAGNPFQVLTDCNGTLLFTLRVLSADGQSAKKDIYLSPVNCP